MADSADNPSPTDTTTGPDQRLVDDVLRDAEALLADAGSREDPPEPVVSLPVSSSVSSSATDPRPSLEAFEPADVQALVDRVDGLLGDLGQLADEVEAAEPSPAPGLDLTLVLPPATPAPENVVPDLGSAGPQVDLFSTPDAAPESSSAEPSPADVVLDSSAIVNETETETSPSPADDLLGDLSAALAEEFDRPDLTAAADPPPTGQSTADSPLSETEVALMAAMTEEFGAEPGDLPPVDDEGDPFVTRADTPNEPSEAAKRLEDLLAQRLAEEYDLVESSDPGEPGVVDAAVTTTTEVTDPVQSDIDAVARAEIEALEALGSDLGPDDEDDGVHVTSVPEVSASSRVEPDASPVDAVPESSASIPAETAVADGDSPEAASTDEDGSSTETEPSDQSSSPRPKPVRPGPSALVRIGSLPFRMVPPKFHRHVTPIALSLAAWVPLAWGYAILGPKPSPPTIDALPAVLRMPADDPAIVDDPAAGVDEEHEVGAADHAAAPDGHH